MEIRFHIFGREFDEILEKSATVVEKSTAPPEFTQFPAAKCNFQWSANMNSVSPHNTAPPLETGSEGSLVGKSKLLFLLKKMVFFLCKNSFILHSVDWSRVPAGLEIFASCRVLTVRQEEDEMEFIGSKSPHNFSAFSCKLF